MRNKMIIILLVVVLLFGGLIALNQFKNKKAVSGNNPYGKETLHQETIDQLDDPLYDNIIIPEDLDKMLEDGEDVTVYYYSPTCVYCLRTTPVLVPITEELGIDMKKMNLLEFDMKDHYDVEGTPTLIHYKDGEEVGRLTGQKEDEEYYEFFEQYVLE